MKNINILKDLKALNKLHTSSVESYTTNNGIVDFACENDGYVDNVVIEGETLVNLFSFKKTESSDNNSIWVHINTDYIYLFKEVEYTLINTSDKNILVDIYSNDTNSYKRNLLIKANSSIKDTLTSNEHYSKCTGLFSDSWSLSDLSVISSTLVILEGDHTDKPISYFEGLKSVGQGDKIEVLSCNPYSNIFNGIWYKGGLNTQDGKYLDMDTYIHTDFMYLTHKSGYWVNAKIFDTNIAKQIVTLFYDKDKNYLGYGNLENTNNFRIAPINNCSYVRFRVEYNVNKNPKMNVIKYNYETQHETVGNLPYIQPQIDKKQISTTLRSLPNGVKDTIEKRGNKYVKVQRCKEIVLDGSEDIREDINQYNDTTIKPLISKFTSDAKIGGINNNNINIYCDKFKPMNIYSPSVVSEGIYYSGGLNMHIRISKTKAKTLEEFKAWLKSNPITVVYELATPQIIELPNFNPQTYKRENTLIINSGVIQCDANFTVNEGIRSELDVIKDKISILDDTTTTINYRNLRDDITFLNGWGIWGNEARFNCYVADNIVKICILLNPSVLTPYTPIFKLPAQYITGRKEFITCVDNNKRCYMGALDETCMFSFENEISSESMYVSINFTYPLIKKVI